jgi:tetratricopeptide (TPR) repeat protein
LLLGLIAEHALAQRFRRPFATALGAWLFAAASFVLAGGDRFENDLRLFGPEVSADPDFVEGHMQLGIHFMLHREPERAASAFEEALRPRPGILAFRDDVLILVNLANVRVTLGRRAEAEELLARAAEGGRPSQAAGIAANRASLAAERGDDGAVVRLLLPHVGALAHPEPLLLLARSLGRMGRREQAAVALRRALPLLPEARRRQLEPLVANVPPGNGS